ncbi:MAG: lytic transglycosylase domain-containing protein [Acidobacteriota bacterium]
MQSSGFDSWQETLSAYRSVIATGLWLALTVAAPSGPVGANPSPGDPRPALVELQIDGRYEEALEVTSITLREDPRNSHRLGLDYLRGHLLDRLCRTPLAAEAFAQAMSNSPHLEMYSRFRLARAQEQSGHPEVAAGLIASVVAAAPATLVEPAVDLLHRTVLTGGDCRLLRGIGRQRLPERSRRQLTVTDGRCAERRGDEAAALELYQGLLREKRDDDPARQAAQRLQDLLPKPPASDLALVLGKTFHWHRHFDQAIELLAPVVREFAQNLSVDQFETGYTHIRSYFWQENYRSAANGFGALAERIAVPVRRAQALYQQGRSLELRGQWSAASRTYRQAYRADPTGRWSAAALIGALRLEWRGGREESSLDLLDLLASRRQWTRVMARAGVFLAASDLVRGRRDRAGHWLDLAERDAARNAVEIAYWRGRLAELDGDLPAAVRRYLRAQELDLYHPIAQEARKRLRSNALAAASQAAGRTLAASDRSDDLFAAWLLLGNDGLGGEARQRLMARYAKDRIAAPILAVAEQPVRRWPLWQGSMRTSENQLLALGIWQEGRAAIDEHFPTSDPSLAFTGAVLLNRAGRTDRAIVRADHLRRRVSDRVPEVFLPERLRRLLYPFAHGDLLATQGKKFGVDPYLLAAVIREESRFDPQALSAASARGLTQFVAPTARRIGEDIGLGPLQPDDLYRPDIAIPLGAAYLQGLLDRARGATHIAVASYNAGEPQARLWRSYCYSPEPAEYFSKVSFRETRGYLRKVLSSWAQYREIYRADLAGS